MYKTLSNNTYERATKTHEFAWYNGTFTDDEINIIQNLCDNVDLEDSITIGSESKEQIEQVRKSKVKFFYKCEENEWIFDKFNNTISVLNETYYNFNLNGYDMIQYTVYDSSYKGKYDWHMDTTLGNSLDSVPFDSRETRKLTCIMLLNDPGVDFCGGDFQIYMGGDMEHSLTPSMKKGTIICFPSFLIHRVKPVILGVRKSLVIWVTGPKFI